MTSTNGSSDPSATKKVSPTGTRPLPKQQQPDRQRHVPQRTCVACRLSSSKRGFVRLVRIPEGRVEIDATGKKPGRGAYLCLREACWDLALKRKRLDAALRTHVAQEDIERLRLYAATLPD